MKIKRDKNRQYYLLASKEYENKFTIALTFLLTILTISYIIWTRLFRVRLPRDLTLEEPYTYIYYVFLELFIVFAICASIAINNWQKRMRGKPTFGRIKTMLLNFIIKRKKLTDIFMFYQSFVNDSLSFVHKYLCLNGIPGWDLGIFDAYLLRLVLFQMFLVNRVFSLNSKRRILIIVLIFSYIPSFLYATVFTYEVLVNRYICYSYMISPILLIPFSFGILRTIMRDHLFIQKIMVQDRIREEKKDDGSTVFHVLDEIKKLDEEWRIQSALNAARYNLRLTYYQEILDGISKKINHYFAYPVLWTIYAIDFGACVLIILKII